MKTIVASLLKSWLARWGITESNRMKNANFIRGLAPLAAGALLLPTAASAQTTSFTGDGWINGVPVPGVFTTDSLGQVMLRGNVHTFAFQGSDPRVAGLDLVIMDVSYNADGTANIQGPAYLQVGTWDAAMTNFAPSGGVWVLNYSGLAQTNGTVQLNAAGYGVGGTIEGQRIAVAVSRGPVPNPLTNPFDPTVPFHRTGTIQPPPLNTTEIVDNFDDNKLTGWITSWKGAALSETNQQLTMHGYWPGVRTVDILDTIGTAYLNRSWSVPEGQTLEWRVDLVGMNEHATSGNIELVNASGNGGYVLFKGRDFIHVCKYSSSGGHAHFVHERVLIQNTNVVLALALTRVTPNLILTARILDKANSNVVLYERSVVDTPDVDRSLTQAEMNAASGMQLNTGSDVKAPPWSSGSYALLHVWQYNYDGQQPAAEVTFDNLEVRTYAVPPLGIERAVRLSWPASATINYAVEAAPTVQGPWLPVQDLITPGMQRITVPLSDTARFFRLRQAP